MSLYDKYIGEIDPSQKKEEQPENSKKNTFILLILVVALIIIGFLQTPIFKNSSELKDGEELARIIEEYKAEHNVLPRSISELNLSGEVIDTSKLTYVQISDDVFEIHFLTNAGRDTVYNSEMKEWK